MSNHIRVLQDYGQLTDGGVIASAGAVVKGLTDHEFPNLPIDVKSLQASIDELVTAMAAQANGGPAATAVKKDKRAALIAKMRKLAHHVQDECHGDPTLVLNAGFLVASPARNTPELETPAIMAIDFGDPGELVIRVKAVGGARLYELQLAALDADDKPGPWQPGGTFHNSREMSVKGLTKFTTYAFQIRAYGGRKGYTPWSDRVSHVVL